MINYSYENLFFEHFAADVLIVSSGATITKTSGVRPVVSGETFKIDNEFIKAESFKLAESLCSEANLVFGKLEASKVTFSFKNDSRFPTDLTTEQIDIYLYFNYDSMTLFKVGTYTVYSDKYSGNNYERSIVAYDMMYYLKDQDITSWYYGYFDDGQQHMLGLALANLFNWLKNDADGPHIDITLESGYNLCNGTFAIGKTIESDSITFEYFVQRVLEFNGAFGHINRDGNFEFVVMKWYDTEPARTVINEERIPPTEHDIVSTWGIGGIDVYDGNNIRKFKVRNTNKKVPSVYNIVDSFVLAEYEAGNTTAINALKKLHSTIHHYNYKSCNVKSTGDLCVEVGDRINVSLLPDEGEGKGWFRSYALERTFSGIQLMTDIYKSKGDKKQPPYRTDSRTAHEGDSDISTDGADGISTVDSEHDRRFCQIVRNLGFRFLDEPSDVECVYDDGNMNVKFKWTDPDDITDSKPETATWAGTVVVRKEGSPPLHEWDGELIVDSTTRDAYKNTYLTDNTIEEDKKYYYGIFPYHIKNGKRWTTFTKVVSVNTSQFIDAPEIYSAIKDTDTGITKVTYGVPQGDYNFIKLVYKQNGIPTDETDGTAIDILQDSTSQTIQDLTGNVWFVIFTDKTSSDPVELKTGTISDDFFALDFNTDGRDSVNYNGSVNISLPFYDSGYEGTLETQRGKLTAASGPVSVSNGSMNCTGAGAYIVWGYDTENINQRVFPENCTVVIENEIYYNDGEGWFDIRMFTQNTPHLSEYLYYCWDTKYAFQPDRWYNLKTKITLVNGLATQAKWYIDDTLNTTTTYSTPTEYICVDKDNPKTCDAVTLHLTAATKVRKFKIYYEED